MADRGAGKRFQNGGMGVGRSRAEQETFRSIDGPQSEPMGRVHGGQNGERSQDRGGRRWTSVGNGPAASAGAHVAGGQATAEMLEGRTHHRGCGDRIGDAAFTELLKDHVGQE